MKVFTEGDGWGKKINFVDEDNVFVGFDYSGQCCENFGYGISDEFTDDYDDVRNMSGESEYQLDAYKFDTSFHETFTPEGCYGGEVAVFRIKSQNDEKYLYLYNFHNGYYSHGFEMKIDDETVEEGYL